MTPTERDVVRLVQNRRKDMGLEFTDRITVGIVTESVELRRAIETNLEYIKTETLTVDLKFEPLPGVDGIALKVGHDELALYITRVVGDM